jgi:hypothetical protein
MRESITPDGPWLEGSWGYHFFALEPLLLTREMAVQAGISVPDAAALKRMFDAPIHCVFPDGTLPNFNDTGLVKLASEAPDYEVGYAIFSRPAIPDGSSRCAARTERAAVGSSEASGGRAAGASK